MLPPSPSGAVSMASEGVACRPVAECEDDEDGAAVRGCDDDDDDDDDDGDGAERHMWSQQRSRITRLMWLPPTHSSSHKRRNVISKVSMTTMTG